MLLIGTQRNEKYIQCSAMPSLKSTQTLKKGKERGIKEGEERRGQRGDALPTLTAKDRRYVCWMIRIPGSTDD